MQTIFPFPCSFILGMVGPLNFEELDATILVLRSASSRMRSFLYDSLSIYNIFVVLGSIVSLYCFSLGHDSDLPSRTTRVFQRSFLGWNTDALL